ncbi:MAG: hypothetical protein QOD72_2823 [Acidimicrobiaceae bacterium]|nr:hypothetical protein [Acidimicrobiaceae bacterium]
MGHAAGVTIEPDPSIEALANQVRRALDSGDLALFADLLDPGVHWGAPDDPAPSCQTRAQVLAWYERGRTTGRRAHVTDTHVHEDKILVELRVVDPSASGDVPLETDRWQVLTCTGGRIVDIRGFETYAEALARVTPTA